MAEISPYYKTNDTTDGLLLETIHFISVSVELILYGVTLIVCSTCAYFLLSSPNTVKYRVKWLLIVLILFSGATTSVILDLVNHFFAWVQYRAYPGGPSAFLLRTLVVAGPDWTLYVMGVVVDGILIHRIFHLYDDWKITILPILLWLCSDVVGVFFALSMSSVHFEDRRTFVMPYFSLELSLNVLLHITLVYRLLQMDRRTRRILGQKHGLLYRNVAQMLVESSFPYALVSIFLLGLFISKSVAANVVTRIYIQVQCMSPVLIILRVAMGRALDKDSISRLNFS
ncbi:hypothetical protein BJ165DRAFT_1358915 [Panaeolus papilionaceus]|nr:hypothetical protein BJ165DRAFT_1358915 [Panaeolus papilionaceus]